MLSDFKQQEMWTSYGEKKSWEVFFIFYYDIWHLDFMLKARLVYVKKIEKWEKKLCACVIRESFEHVGVKNACQPLSEPPPRRALTIQWPGKGGPRLILFSRDCVWSFESKGSFIRPHVGNGRPTWVRMVTNCLAWDGGPPWTTKQGFQTRAWWSKCRPPTCFVHMWFY